MSVEEVRKDIGGRLDAAWFKDEVTVVTKYGQDRGLLMSFKAGEELETLRAENKRLRAENKKLRSGEK